MCRAVFGILGVCVLASAVGAADPPPTTQPLSIDAALDHLTADDYATRHAAEGQLHAAIAAQIQRMTKQQDPEAAARAQSALIFQEGLTAWTIQTAALPDAQRKALLEWGFGADVAPLLATIFGNNPAGKAQAIVQLGKLPGDQATDALALIVVANQPDTGIDALNAIWDRKPTDGALNTLWSCVASKLDPRSVRVTQTRVVQPAFGHFSILPQQPYYSIAPQAAQVLMHWNSPVTAKQCDAQIAALAADKTIQDWEFTEGAQDRLLGPLVEGFHSKAAIPLMARLALGQQTSYSNSNPNGVPVFESNRTEALGVLVQLTGQDPAQYGLFRGGEMFEWAVHTANDEQAAVDKAKKWWDANKDKVMSADGGNAATTTKP